MVLSLGFKMLMVDCGVLSLKVILVSTTGHMVAVMHLSNTLRMKV